MSGNGGDAGLGGRMVVGTAASDEGEDPEDDQDDDHHGGGPPMPLPVLHGMESLLAGPVRAELGGNRLEARSPGPIGGPGVIEDQLAICASSSSPTPSGTGTGPGGGTRRAAGLPVMWTEGVPVYPAARSSLSTGPANPSVDRTARSEMCSMVPSAVRYRRTEWASSGFGRQVSLATTAPRATSTTAITAIHTSTIQPDSGPSCVADPRERPLGVQFRAHFECHGTERNRRLRWR